MGCPGGRPCPGEGEDTGSGNMFFEGLCLPPTPPANAVIRALRGLTLRLA